MSLIRMVVTVRAKPEKDVGVMMISKTFQKVFVHSAPVNDDYVDYDDIL